jgi:hypothetical protein
LPINGLETGHSERSHLGSTARRIRSPIHDEIGNKSSEFGLAGVLAKIIIAETAKGL